MKSITLLNKLQVGIFALQKAHDYRKLSRIANAKPKPNQNKQNKTKQTEQNKTTKVASAMSSSED